MTTRSQILLLSSVSNAVCPLTLCLDAYFSVALKRPAKVSVMYLGSAVMYAPDQTQCAPPKETNKQCRSGHPEK
jgi:hypothetical protein